MGRRNRTACYADRRAAGTTAPDRARTHWRSGRNQQRDPVRELARCRAGYRNDYSGNLQRRMRRADRIGARAAILLGDDELARGIATLRDLDSGEQSEVSLDALDGAAYRSEQGRRGKDSFDTLAYAQRLKSVGFTGRAGGSTRRGQPRDDRGRHGDQVVPAIGDGGRQVGNRGCGKSVAGRAAHLK